MNFFRYVNTNYCPRSLIQDTTIKVYVRVNTPGPGSDMSFINTTVDIGLGDSIKDLREMSQLKVNSSMIGGNMKIKPGSFRRGDGGLLTNEDRTLMSYGLENASSVECDAYNTEAED